MCLPSLSYNKQCFSWSHCIIQVNYVCLAAIPAWMPGLHMPAATCGLCWVPASMLPVLHHQDSCPKIRVQHCAFCAFWKPVSSRVLLYVPLVWHGVYMWWLYSSTRNPYGHTLFTLVRKAHMLSAGFTSINVGIDSLSGSINCQKICFVLKVWEYVLSLLLVKSLVFQYNVMMSLKFFSIWNIF